MGTQPKFFVKSKTNIVVKRRSGQSLGSVLVKDTGVGHSSDLVLSCTADGLAPAALSGLTAGLLLGVSSDKNNDVGPSQCDPIPLVKVFQSRGEPEDVLVPTNSYGVS